MTVGNSIPNGTSLSIIRGTAICLVKKIMRSARVKEGDEVVYDYLRVGQLSGCLGVEEEGAGAVLSKVRKGQSPEEVIDELLVARFKLKEETQELMKGKLQQLK